MGISSHHGPSHAHPTENRSPRRHPQAQETRRIGCQALPALSPFGAAAGKTLKLLETVENADKPTEHSGRLTDLILELTDAGMDQFFLQSLKATKANFVVQQSASLGLSGVQKVMGTVIRNIIGRMDDRQLLSVCGSIRQFMV